MQTATNLSWITNSVFGIPASGFTSSLIKTRNEIHEMKWMYMCLNAFLHRTFDLNISAFLNSFGWGQFARNEMYQITSLNAMDFAVRIKMKSEFEKQFVNSPLNRTQFNLFCSVLWMSCNSIRLTLLFQMAEWLQRSSVVLEYLWAVETNWWHTTELWTIFNNISVHNFRLRMHTKMNERGAVLLHF